MRDHGAEQDDLRRRLAAVVQELRRRKFGRTEIAREAGREDWSTLYRQITGKTRVDPLVVGALEAALDQIQQRRAASQLSVRSARMVGVVGFTGPGGKILPPPLPEIAVVDSRIGDGEFRAVEVGDGGDDEGVEPGDILVYEVGVVPAPGNLCVVQSGTVLHIKRFTEQGIAVAPGGVILGVGRLRVSAV